MTIKGDSVLVIDVGSNSIKSLLAKRTGTNSICPYHEGYSETRISSGINGHPPSLSEAAMEAGLNAIVTLLAEAKAITPVDQGLIVATAAVRTATNGADFATRVEEATGIPLTIIDGETEATGIARGVASDPSIQSSFQTFTLFDLGGGSLECIEFSKTQILKRQSFPLGAVRLLEQWVDSPTDPLSEQIQEAIRTHCRETLRNFLNGCPTDLVGCGGAVTTTRKLAAAMAGNSFEDSSPSLPLTTIQELRIKLCGLPLEERKQLPGMPPKRADIMPIGLLVVEELMNILSAKKLHHSLWNLRYGLAMDLLYPKRNAPPE